MQQRAQLSPSNPVRPQVGTFLCKIVHLARVISKRDRGDEGAPDHAAVEHVAGLAPKRPPMPLNILTYPVSCMIMVQLIVRNPID
jgi:hypothetical protein